MNDERIDLSVLDPQGDAARWEAWSADTAERAWRARQPPATLLAQWAAWWRPLSGTLILVGCGALIAMWTQRPLSPAPRPRDPDWALLAWSEGSASSPGEVFTILEVSDE